MQDCSNSIANALELPQSCTKPSVYVFNFPRFGVLGHMGYDEAARHGGADLPIKTLQWRHNECDCVSNHQPRDCLLNTLFRRIPKKIPKLCVNALCEGNSPGTSEFPAQRASSVENVSIWWLHHDLCSISEHGTQGKGGLGRNPAWGCGKKARCSWQTPLLMHWSYCTKPSIYVFNSHQFGVLGHVGYDEAIRRTGRRYTN